MAFDPARPNIARAYDYMLGGKDHSAPDRDRRTHPGDLPRRPADGRENRRFLLRALHYVLVHGVTQYMDLGAGLPTAPAVHEIVRRHSARAASATSTTTPS